MQAASPLFLQRLVVGKLDCFFNCEIVVPYFKEDQWISSPSPKFSALPLLMCPLAWQCIWPSKKNCCRVMRSTPMRLHLGKYGKADIGALQCWNEKSFHLGKCCLMHDALCR